MGGNFPTMASRMGMRWALLHNVGAFDELDRTDVLPRDALLVDDELQLAGNRVDVVLPEDEEVIVGEVDLDPVDALGSGSAVEHERSAPAAGGLWAGRCPRPYGHRDDAALEDKHLAPHARPSYGFGMRFDQLYPIRFHSQWPHYSATRCGRSGSLISGSWIWISGNSKGAGSAIAIVQLQPPPTHEQVVQPHPSKTVYGSSCFMGRGQR